MLPMSLSGSLTPGLLWRFLSRAPSLIRLKGPWLLVDKRVFRIHNGQLLDFTAESK